MKVLHLETGMNLYGGARQVLYLVDGLANRGVHNVLVAVEGSAVASAAQHCRAELALLPAAGDLYLPIFAQVRRLVRRHRPDLVHLHSRRGADVLGGLALAGLNLPTVLSRRVDSAESRAVAAVKYRLYDRVIAISAGIRRQLLAAGVPGKKVVCVPSAVDESEWQHAAPRSEWEQTFGIPQSALIIAVVAQLTRRKGHDDLLAALPAIAGAAPDVHAVFFGQGPRREALEEKTRASGMTQRVTFTGFRDDLPRWLGGIDLLVHPAHREGLGVAVLQAACAGRAVVAARAGGIPEAVSHGETGLLVPPGDVPALAQAVTGLLRDPARRNVMGEAGRAHIRHHFSLDAMVSGNLEVYRSLMKHNAARPSGGAG